MRKFKNKKQFLHSWIKNSSGRQLGFRRVKLLTAYCATYKPAVLGWLPWVQCFPSALGSKPVQESPVEQERAWVKKHRSHRVDGPLIVLWKFRKNTKIQTCGILWLFGPAKKCKVNWDYNGNMSRMTQPSELKSRGRCWRVTQVWLTD